MRCKNSDNATVTVIGCRFRSSFDRESKFDPYRSVCLGLLTNASTGPENWMAAESPGVLGAINVHLVGHHHYVDEGS